MTQLDSQILRQLSGAYNNILNNNLNDNLTILTIISILLAVLAVITGFFGMNVPSPWQKSTGMDLDCNNVFGNFSSLLQHY